LVGVEPKPSDIDFAKRVEEAQSVDNSPATFRIVEGGRVIVGEIVFSTPFLSNGILAIGPQLATILGNAKRKIQCCSAIEMNGVASINQSSLYGLASLRQHLLRHHGLQEGSTFQFEIDKETFKVVF
jgi:hypothetical protein